MRSRSLILAAAFVAAISAHRPAQASVTYLDFSGFDARMGDLATSAGIASFSSGELASIRSGIQSGLESAYSDFTAMSFTSSLPTGTFSTLRFGRTDAGGTLGRAQHIDFRNRDQADVADVFSSNFDFIVNEFSGSTGRAAQLSQLTTALAGTAVHELGHNLGLRHHDAYSEVTYTGTSVATGGSQNAYYMATGSTGLSETGRESARTFSTNSVVKLEYAQGTLAVNPVKIDEGADAGGTTATARTVDLESLPVSGRLGEVIAGEIAASGDVDVFRIDGSQVGDFLTADINNDYADGLAPSSIVDSILTVFAADGTTILGTNDDTLYSTTAFGSGTTRDLDSILYNIPTIRGQDVFIQVRGFSTTSGAYELLVHTDGQINMTMIPEPSSMMLMSGIAVLGGLGCCIRKRFQRSVA